MWHVLGRPCYIGGGRPCRHGGGRPYATRGRPCRNGGGQPYAPRASLVAMAEADPFVKETIDNMEGYDRSTVGAIVEEWAMFS